MKQITSKRLLWPVLLALLVGLVVPAIAQETTATLQGFVKDPTGAVVAKAKVEVTSPALIGSKTVETDSAGYYRISNLPGGTYTLTVSAAGFTVHKQTGIDLLVGKLPTIDIVLKVGATSETVEVSGAAPLVDVTQSKVATALADEQIVNMPRGRSFESLINFAPGARNEPLQGGFQIDGASASENAYLVEGMDTTAIQTGVVGFSMPTDMVQEVQIKTSGFEAEFGGALGGVVNVVTKKGGNAWHGSVFTYLAANYLNANQHSDLTYDPKDALTPVYYQYKKDDRKILEPGFELGGYVIKNRLWLYNMFKPTLSSLSRSVDFQPSDSVCSGPNGWTGCAASLGLLGTKGFRQTDNVYWNHSRVDFSPTNKVRTYVQWEYAYERWQGALPGRDSQFAQSNSAASTDPRIYRNDRGATLPNQAFITGFDYNPTSKIVVAARYGYWATNNHDFGKTVGDYFVWRTSGLSAKDTSGASMPAAWKQPRGYTNIPSPDMNFFDKYTRHGLNVDASYYARFAGTHTFKWGYYMNRLANDVDYEYNTSYNRIYVGSSYTPILPSGGTQCTIIKATEGAGKCRGTYGYWIQRDYSTIGKVSSNNQALYLQDGWTLGKGVTLNLGVRFDNEYLPSYQKDNTVMSDPISFGWTQKVAPRLGGAWDVFNNGKLKVYGSFGLFYDIMKYELPRGSFGGDWWKDCVFTLNVADPALIHPVKVGGRTCPSNGGTPGTLIEVLDWRATANTIGGFNGKDGSRIDPNLKPMRQREFVAGADWALKSNLGLEARYSRKRLDRTIEDNGFMDPTQGEVYYIANPGEGIVKNLLSAADCAPGPCPTFPKAIRNYDGLEVRLTKKASGKWWGSASYTYSSLWGNYGGLTSTDENARHSPNVNRYFDEPYMNFDAHGKSALGPLATDRPHTLKLNGYYNQKWFGGNTILGFSQQLYSGTPMTTEIWAISSTPIYPENRGNWMPLTENADGTWAAGTLEKGKRTPSFSQTDMNITHEFRLSKTNEALRASVSMIVLNVLNQTNPVHYFSEPSWGAIGQQLDFSSSTTPSGYDYSSFFKGFDWVKLANDQGVAFDRLYGKADVFQSPRSLRFQVKFSF